MDRRDGAARIADTSVADRFSDAVFSASAIDHLRADVERLRGNLTAAASPDVLQEVDRAMGVLALQVKAARTPPADAPAGDPGTAISETLVARLDGLREGIEGLRASEPTVALAAAVGAMSRKLDLIDAKAVDPITVARLQLQTAELKDLVNRTLASAAATAEKAREDAARQLAEIGAGAVEAVAAASADFSRMAADTLSRIETRLEQHLAERAPPAGASADDLAPLRERLDQLSRDVRALGTGTDGQLAARMAELLDRIDAGGGIEAATLAPLVGVLERHLVTLTERMGASHARLSRLDGIETLLQRMTFEMQRMHRETATGWAEAAVRAAPAAADHPAPEAATADHSHRDIVQMELLAQELLAQELLAQELLAQEVLVQEETGQPESTVADAARRRSLPVLMLPAAASRLDGNGTGAQADTPRDETGDAPAGSDDHQLAPVLETWPRAPRTGEAGALSVLPRPSAGPETWPAHEAVWQVTEAPRPQPAPDVRSRDRLAAPPKRRPAGAPPVSADRQSPPKGRARPAATLDARHAAALEAAILEPAAAEDEAPRVRLDWVAAANRAEDREKGAGVARKRRPVRWTHTAIRLGGVAAAVAVLGLVTVKLTAREGASTSIQALVTAPAAVGSASAAPVDKALLATLPPAVGPDALKTAALAGDADAACEVGIRYADGKGTDVDTGAAMKWLGFAAAHGSVPAAYRLGSMYEYTNRNVAEARKLYRWAAERGNLRAMHNLGVLYSDGADGKPDWPNAITWFRKAADQGLRDSQYNLGVIYGRGLSGGVDRAEAWKWFSLAANQGDTDSARKRDEVANKAEGGVVDRAKAAVAAFVPGAVNEAANAVPVKAEWEVAGPGDAAPRKSASRS